MRALKQIQLSPPAAKGISLTGSPRRPPKPPKPPSPPLVGLKGVWVQITPEDDFLAEEERVTHVTPCFCHGTDPFSRGPKVLSSEGGYHLG